MDRTTRQVKHPAHSWRFWAWIVIAAINLVALLIPLTAAAADAEGGMSGGVNDLLAAMVFLTPIVIAAVQAAKLAGSPDRLAPVLAVVIGVAIAFVFPPDVGWRNEVAAGVLSGLSAAGVYSGVKATVGK